MLKRFIFRKEYYDALKSFSDEMYREALFGICRYALYGIMPDDEETPTAYMVVMLCKDTIDSDNRALDNKDGRNTDEYKKWRRAVFERDGYRCQICGQVGGRLNAHHIEPYATVVSKRYDVDNGMTLCEGCHKEVHYAK